MSKLKAKIEKISKNQKKDLMESYKTVNAKSGEYTARGNAIRSELNATKFAPRVEELEQMKETLICEAKVYYNQAVLSQKVIKTPYVNQYNNLIKYIVDSQTIDQLEAIFEDLAMDKDNVELFAIMKMYTNLRASRVKDITVASRIKAAASLSRINSLIGRVIPSTGQLHLSDLRSVTEHEFTELVYCSNPYAYAWD